MTNYTSSFLPVVSHELLDRIRRNINLKDFTEILNRARYENPHLAKEIFYETTSDSETEFIFTQRSLLPLKSSIVLYGILEEAAKQLGTTIGHENYTSRGLPVVSQSILEKLINTEGLIMDTIENAQKMLDENPVVGKFIHNFTILTGTDNNLNPQETTQIINLSVGTTYKLLDAAGKEIFGLDDTQTQNRTYNWIH